jgi:phosphoglycerate dehydrogenase-like enzyme
MSDTFDSKRQDVKPYAWLMSRRCVVLDDYQGVALSMADWSTLDVAVQTVREHITDEEALAELLGEAEIVVVMRERTPIRASLLSRLPALRLLVTTGMRNVALDVAAARERNITVCGTASRPEPPAELTWALIFGLTKHLVTESTALRHGGQWQSTVGSDLAGARLGLLGFGNIGVRVARVGRALGMAVSAWSEHLTADRTDAEGVRLASSKHALLAESDIVSIHLVLSRRTRGLVDAAALAAMKPTGYLVNTSRAPIVDQEALVDALRAGRIAGAGLDVFDAEPLPADHPYRSLPNVLGTPHIGYVTAASYHTYYGEAVEDIAGWLAGSPIRVLG